MEKKRSCNFDVNGVCYSTVCFSDVACGAKMDAGDNGKIMRASDAEIKERSRLIGLMPKMEVMSPTVVNVSNPPDENVSSQEIVSRDPDDELNVLPANNK